uniref:ABC-2 type transporter transmembrane domain-containing protein n=1 Tax=Timema poppense TaxID=170557 RepID=A0A7R9CT57_TIMPO|nr:unnamed protein product [Timema poppensis]
MENNFFRPLSTVDRDSNLDPSVIGSLIYYESSALDHAATEAGAKSLRARLLDVDSDNTILGRLLDVDSDNTILGRLLDVGSDNTILGRVLDLDSDNTILGRLPDMDSDDTILGRLLDVDSDNTILGRLLDVDSDNTILGRLLDVDSDNTILGRVLDLYSDNTILCRVLDVDSDNKILGRLLDVDSDNTILGRLLDVDSDNTILGRLLDVDSDNTILGRLLDVDSDNTILGRLPDMDSDNTILGRVLDVDSDNTILGRVLDVDSDNTILGRLLDLNSDNTILGRLLDLNSDNTILGRLLDLNSDNMILGRVLDLDSDNTILGRLPDMDSDNTILGRLLDLDRDDTILGRLLDMNRNNMIIGRLLDLNSDNSILGGFPDPGLDDLSSSQCIVLLKKLAEGGRTVICSIHTPSARMFAQFDHVYIVSSGQCVFQGQGSDMVPFLSSLGLPCPKHYNPADFVIEVSSGEYGDHTEKMVAAVDNGRCYRWTSTPSVPIHIDSPSCSDDIISESSDKPDFQHADISEKIYTFDSSTWVQFRILTYRMLLQSWRNPLLLGTMYLACVYITTGQPLEVVRYLQFLIICLLTAISSESLGFAISSTLSVVNSTFVGPTMAVPLMLLAVYGLGGESINIPLYIKPFMYMSYLRYALEGLVIATYGNNRAALICPDEEVYCHFKHPKTLLQETGMEKANIWVAITGLVVFYIIFRSIFYFLLKRRLSMKRSFAALNIVGRFVKSYFTTGHI